MTTTSTAETLTPSYKLPIAIVLLSLPLLFIQPIIGGVIALLGLFLLYQTSTIRLRFTDTALEVLRKENILKIFPYVGWQTWTVFWPPVPILFYFKEVESIHFLPMLFSPAELRDRLTAHCAELEV